MLDLIHHANFRVRSLINLENSAADLINLLEKHILGIIKFFRHIRKKLL